jgi:hypothetical protein
MGLTNLDINAKSVPHEWYDQFCVKDDEIGFILIFCVNILRIHYYRCIRETLRLELIKVHPGVDVFSPVPRVEVERANRLAICLGYVL